MGVASCFLGFLFFPSKVEERALVTPPEERLGQRCVMGLPSALWLRGDPVGFHTGRGTELSIC